MAKCLIIDDNPTIRAFMADALIDLGHFGTAVEKGEMALEMLAKEHEFEIIFLDVHMPGMSGLDVLKELKDRFPDLKVVMLTGDLDPITYENVESIYPNVSGFLHKPFTYDTLNMCIDVVLNKRGRYRHKKQQPEE